MYDKANTARQLFGIMDINSTNNRQYWEVLHLDKTCALHAEMTTLSAGVILNKTTKCKLFRWQTFNSKLWT